MRTSFSSVRTSSSSDSTVCMRPLSFNTSELLAGCPSVSACSTCDKRCLSSVKSSRCKLVISGRTARALPGLNFIMLCSPSPRLHGVHGDAKGGDTLMHGLERALGGREQAPSKLKAAPICRTKLCAFWHRNSTCSLPRGDTSKSSVSTGGRGPPCDSP